MSFRLKPLYFKRDGPVCTRSASSFCRNPLNFCAHILCGSNDEPLDPACEPLDQACRLKPSMVQFVHEVYPVFVVALSTVLASSIDVALALSKKYLLIIPVERATTKNK